MVRIELSGEQTWMIIAPHRIWSLSESYGSSKFASTFFHDMAVIVYVDIISDKDLDEITA